MPWSQTLPFFASPTLPMAPPTYSLTARVRPHSCQVVARRCPSGHLSHSPQSIYPPVHPPGSFLVFRRSHWPPQCSHLISQHLANSREHVRAAAQEFTRADGTLKFSYTRLTTEIVNCCSSYQLPQPSPGGLPPIVGPLPAQGPLGQHARSRFKCTTSPPGGIT